MWAWLQREVKKAKEGSAFMGTGMHPNGAGGLDSDNFDPTHGFSFKDTGDAEFNGNVDIGGTLNVTGNTVIGGTLSLPAGIIDNDALANPVVPASIWEQASGFTVGVAWGTVITKAVTVPAGCTKLVASGKARVTAFYNNAGTGTGVDYLYADLTIGGLDSDFYPLAVTDNGGSGTNQVFRDVVLTGLAPGSTVTFYVDASTGSNTWAGPTTNNEARLGASLLWFR
jgi:hypothetical protein